jgi:sialic acid synthase SpsE
MKSRKDIARDTTIKTALAKENLKIKFIADIGSNHNGSLKRSLTLIDRASEVGCWGVKFQLFKAEQLWRDPQVAKEMKERELPEEFIERISNYSKQKGLHFGCTPFYPHAVNVLRPHADFLKIGSYELLYRSLIERVAYTNINIIMSVGMGTIEEISNAVRWIRNIRGAEGSDIRNENLTILHCNSSYPAEPLKCNMPKIDELKSLFMVPIGWSDHTVNAGVISSAIEHGCRVIEFHLDLEDKQGAEFEHGHCWTPGRIRRVIQDSESWQEANIYLSTPGAKELRAQRTDPSDGMRPLKIGV